MKKFKNFKIFWNYIKDDKFKLFIYILLVALLCIPQILTAYFWGIAVEVLLTKDFSKFIMYILLYEGIFILFYAILQIPKDFLYNYFEIKFTKNVSNDLYKKIDKLPAVAFEEIGVGEFVNRLYSDPNKVMDLLSRIVRLFCNGLVVIILIIISFKVSYILFFEMLLLILIMGFISNKIFPKIKKDQDNISDENDAFLKIATENITGIREVKALGITKNIEKNLFKVIDKLYVNANKLKKDEIWYYGLNNMAYFMIELLILLTSGKLLVDGIITLPLFLMMHSYMGKIDNFVENFSDFGVSFNKVSVSLNRINQILNNELYQDQRYGNKVLENPIGIIEFRNVKFKYKEKEDYTLNDLNLLIKSNKKVAIVGRSGNGKTTIFNLLLRYFDANEGSILIDNINIKDLTEESLRNNISIIRQNPYLFNLTILENFKLVKKDVTLQEVRECCKKAYIDDYIMGLPNQYDTLIGEGGINLSGGQKQRLAIARVLLLNTKIILFDEATSALDNESQKFIKKSIDDLVNDHTIIIVAHRLSTIIDADMIHVIEKGKLIGSGTHKELLNNCLQYQNLYLSEPNFNDNNFIE